MLVMSLVVSSLGGGGGPVLVVDGSLSCGLVGDGPE